MVKPYKKQFLEGGLIQYSFKYDKKQKLEVVVNDANEFRLLLQKNIRKDQTATLWFSYYYPEVGHYMPNAGSEIDEEIDFYDPAEEYASKNIPPCDGTR